MYIYQKTINNSDCGKVTFRNSILYIKCQTFFTPEIENM